MEFSKPVPVVTPLGDGWAIYVSDSGMLENDVWTVILEDGGLIKHFRTDQIKIYKNATFGIKESKNLN